MTIFSIIREEMNDDLKFYYININATKKPDNVEYRKERYSKIVSNVNALDNKVR